MIAKHTRTGVALVALASAAWLALAAAPAQAADLRVSTVEVVNTTAYTAHFTIHDYYGDESGTVAPGATERWTASHDGTIGGGGYAYDDDGNELTWEYTEYDMTGSDNLRITLN